MPTLRLATICEKVIMDTNAVPSLIGLFSELKISVPQGTSFPANAVAPKEWAVFCTWECTMDEAGQEFQQVFVMTSSVDEVFGPPQIIKFTPQRDRLSQNVVANSQGVPIGREGKVTVTTHVELEGRTVVPPLALSFDVRYVPA
jgi:hypothetical protein